MADPHAIAYLASIVNQQMQSTTVEKERRRGLATVTTCGLLLVGWSLGVALLARFFVYGSKPSTGLMSAFIVLNIAAGMIFLTAMWLGRRVTPTRRVLLGLVVIGAVMRIIQIGAAPILEDDVYRYLWDGAVLAAGHNPYEHAPRDIQDALLGSTEAPGDLIALGRESGPVLQRINHAQLRTVYPPVAQMTFAAAYLIRPWSLPAWRALLLLFDLATLLLLFRLLAALGRPLTWAAIYWWHPTVVLSIFNGSHMDALVLPFVTGAVLLAVGRRPIGSMLSLALGAGAKLWPLVLLPILIRQQGKTKQRLIVGLALFSILMAVFALPIALAGPEDATGFRTYANTWHNNQMHFWLLTKFCEALLPIVGVDLAHVSTISRGIVVILMLTWLTYLFRRPVTGPRDIARLAMLAVAGLYLLSPTQFPWYYCWMVPLLAVSPYWPLLVYAALLPLYHLHYDYPVVVAAEHLPVWCLIGYDLIRRRPAAQHPVEAQA
jgi:alpha-1,6-mannosyltransferase